MKGWMKALSAVVVLAVAAMAAGIAILKSLDFNQYRGLLADQVKAATGRELRIAGNLHLDLSLHPALAVGDVSFANAAWGSRPAMATLKELAAEVELLPLLTGDVRVRRLVLNGLDLLLETDKQGRGNWELAGPEKPAEKAAAPAGRLPVVNAVRVKDLLVTYRDGRHGTKTTLRLGNLDARADAIDAPMSVRLSGDLDGRPFQATGRLGPLATLIKGGAPYPVTLRGQALGVDLRVEGAVADVRELRGIDLMVEATGKELAETLTAVKSLVPALKDAAPPAIGPFKVSARAKGEAGALSLSAIDVAVGREDQLRLGATGAIANINRAAGVELKISVDGKDAAPVIKAFGGKLAAIPPFKLAAAVSNPPGAYVVDGLAVSIGNSDIAGRVTVKTPDGKAPAVDATLTSRLLDLDALAALSPATPAPAKADGKKAARVFSADPLPVDALKFADARIHLKAGKLIAAGVAVEDLDIGATLSGGRLEVKPLAATLAGGKVNGDATLDGTRPMPALSVNLDVRQVDYGALLRALNLSDIASGKADATLGLKGQGASVRAIMAGLDGRARIVSQGGRIESGLLNVLSADIASALPFIDSKSDNNIRCAVVDFDVRKGKAAARTLVFETGGLSMIGSGGIDLADETIAMNIDPRAKKLSVLKLTLVPVNVGGTLADPSVSADVGGAAVGAVTGAVKTAKDIASGGVSALGGLIGLGDKKDDAQARIDDTDYCKLALAGGPVRRVKPDAARQKPAAAPAPAPMTPPAGRKDSTADKIDKKLDEIGKGLDSALKGLFGK